MFDDQVYESEAPEEKMAEIEDFSRSSELCLNSATSYQEALTAVENLNTLEEPRVQVNQRVNRENSQNVPLLANPRKEMTILKQNFRKMVSLVNSTFQDTTRSFQAVSRDNKALFKTLDIMQKEIAAVCDQVNLNSDNNANTFSQCVTPGYVKGIVEAQNKQINDLKNALDLNIGKTKGLSGIVSTRFSKMAETISSLKTDASARNDALNNRYNRFTFSTSKKLVSMRALVEKENTSQATEIQGMKKEISNLQVNIYFSIIFSRFIKCFVNISKF